MELEGYNWDDGVKEDSLLDQISHVQLLDPMNYQNDETVAADWLLAPWAWPGQGNTAIEEDPWRSRGGGGGRQRDQRK